jgi:hypothetical protein
MGASITDDGLCVGTTLTNEGQDFSDEERLPAKANQGRR